MHSLQYSCMHTHSLDAYCFCLHACNSHACACDCLLLQTLVKLCRQRYGRHEDDVTAVLLGDDDVL
jgi:hypothetical protein